MEYFFGKKKEQESLFTKWNTKSDETQNKLETEKKEKEKLEKEKQIAIEKEQQLAIEKKKKNQERRDEKIPELIGPFIQDTIERIDEHTKTSAEMTLEINIPLALISIPESSAQITSLQLAFLKATEGTEDDTPTQAEQYIFVKA